MLLILDNFEQLVASAWLVSKILQTSPEVHIIITSRQALNLREEWRWSMLGMNFPTGSASEPIEAYDAVQLFTERARRFRNDFSLANEMVGVKRICQLTEGMPLALELAAAWVHVLSCEQIADEIQRGVEFLSTSISDMPDQHRSMHSIFERTWDMLTPQQCTTFMKLSVFRGGFTYEAARDIAEASPVLLAELIDKALIRKARADHYDIHELLRQYADAHLQSGGPRRVSRLHSIITTPNFSTNRSPVRQEAHICNVQLTERRDKPSVKRQSFSTFPKCTAPFETLTS
jgi:predicted ATPase